jgi:hypothetical protein
MFFIKDDFQIPAYNSNKAVEPWHTVSEYARNVVALGEMEHQTAELFEPAGRVFGCRAMSLRAIVAGHFERSGCPGSTATL